jgi:hypothetical protein
MEDPLMPAMKTVIWIVFGGLMILTLFFLRVCGLLPPSKELLGRVLGDAIRFFSSRWRNLRHRSVQPPGGDLVQGPSPKQQPDLHLVVDDTSPANDQTRNATAYRFTRADRQGKKASRPPPEKDN